jgi:CubicO group peptidase (beta-lactamase class C family)
MSRSATLFAFLGCIVSVACAHAQPVDDRARIADALLEALVETSGVPGISASYTRDGELVWTGVAGFRDVERRLPVVAETEFRLASVSKLVTAVAGARLVQSGLLDPDAPVQTALPWLRNDWPAISARQLAAHISGIPHYQAVDQNRGHIRYVEVREAVGVFSDRNLLFAPGASYSYSSYGYTLLSATIEAAAHEPFLDFVARDVVADLAIRPDTDPIGPFDAAPYEFEHNAPVRAEAHDYSYSYGGAGFRGSSPALAMFGARVMSNEFLAPQTRAFMWAPARLADGSAVMDEQDHVGFGWRVGVDTRGERIAHHAGTTSGARSLLLLYPDSNESVSVLSNALWVAAIKETAVVLVAPFRIDADVDAPACPTDATHYSGRYQDDNISGEVQFAVVDGVCRGTISANNRMGAWFNDFPQADADRLPVIALTADRRLGRAALVTPAGLYDFSCSAQNTCRAVFGTRRMLEITLR